MILKRANFTFKDVYKPHIYLKGSGYYGFICKWAPTIEYKSKVHLAQCYINKLNGQLNRRSESNKRESNDEGIGYENSGDNKKSACYRDRFSGCS